MHHILRYPDNWSQHTAFLPAAARWAWHVNWCCTVLLRHLIHNHKPIGSDVIEFRMLISFLFVVLVTAVGEESCMQRTGRVVGGFLKRLMLIWWFTISKMVQKPPTIEHHGNSITGHILAHFSYILQCTCICGPTCEIPSSRNHSSWNISSTCVVLVAQWPCMRCFHYLCVAQTRNCIYSYTMFHLLQCVDVCGTLLYLHG